MVRMGADKSRESLENAKKLQEIIRSYRARAGLHTVGATGGSKLSTKNRSKIVN